MGAWRLLWLAFTALPAWSQPSPLLLQGVGKHQQGLYAEAEQLYR
jgi:hypothetical protein